MLNSNIPNEQLKDIRNKLIPILERQQNHFIDDLLPNLERQKVLIRKYNQLNEKKRTTLLSFFCFSIFI